MLAWVIGVALMGQADGIPNQVVAGVREQIVSGKYKRVAVCPQPICRAGDLESFASADIGPQGRVWCENLFNFLNSNAQADGFSMTNPRSVSKAMEGVTLEDLGDRTKLRQLSDRLKADVLVVIEVTLRPGNSVSGRTWYTQAKLINLISNTESTSTPERATLSLSDWAFMGHSFEARRWIANRLELVDFSEGMTLADGYAMGLSAEQTQYNFLNKERPHPLLSSAPRPYGIQIVVGNDVRPMNEFKGDLYVQLEPGENFGIRMQNDDARPVLCALYIDGVNTIGKQFQHPLMNPPADRWSLVPGYRGRLDGWFLRGNTDNGPHELHRFRIVPKPQAVAAGFGQSVDGQFGMITAIFYTNGIEGIVPVPALLAGGSRGGSQFGIGADQANSINLNFTDAKAGLMLMAITINYRTGRELEEMVRAQTPRPNSPPPTPDTSSPVTLNSNQNQSQNSNSISKSKSKSKSRPNQNQALPTLRSEPNPVIQKPDSTPQAKIPGEDETFPVSAALKKAGES